MEGRYPDLNAIASCEVDLDKSAVNIYIKQSGSQVVVSFHHKNETEYKKCVTIEVGGMMMPTFFMSMMARSVEGSKLRYDVSSMTFSTDGENTGVSEFEAKFDENIPKLFKEISFYKANIEFLKAKTKEGEPEAMNIPAVYKKQAAALEMVDYSNTQLGRSIEETASILSFIENQNTSTNELAHGLVFSLNKWLEDSQKQYEIMDRDVGIIVNEMQGYNFDGLLASTEELMDNLNKRLEDTSKDFKDFMQFSSLIKRNLKSLKNKKDQIGNFDRMIRNMKRDPKLKSTSKLQTVVAILLVVLGLFIIVALLVILYHLSSTGKRDILG